MATALSTLMPLTSRIVELGQCLGGDRAGAERVFRIASVLTITWNAAWLSPTEPNRPRPVRACPRNQSWTALVLKPQFAGRHVEHHT